MEKTLENLRPEDLIAMRKKGPAELESETKYVAVKLSSVGKLGLPAVVHVRDYSYSDALMLATASTNVEIVEAITKVIDSITQEDLELDRLTTQDVMEILMTVQGTWYSPIMEFPYYIDETLTGDDLTKKENISKATIKINSIKTVPFPETERVPFEVKDSSRGFSAMVDIPRFYNEVIVNKYIEKKYAELDNRMESVNQKIKNGTNTLEEFQQYMDYREAKTTDMIKALQALQILSVNGKELNTLGEKIQALDEFPLRAWTAVTSHIQKNLNFGVQPEVTFQCEITGKMLTRRFPFRVMDFLPTLESLNNAGDGILIC